MIIKSVVLRNIRSYLSEKIIFPEGSLLLSGDIGSGKSTILLAIEFALFGVIRGEVDGAALLRHGKTDGNIELRFSLGGKDVIIYRALHRTKTSVNQTAGYLVVDGIKTDCTPIELKARVLDMLGYPKSLLNKSKSLIYRYTVYTPQEEMKHILFEDAPARLDTLRKIFQIDGYKLIRDNASVMLHSLKEKIAEFSAKTEDLDAKKKLLDDFTQKLNTALNNLSLLTPLLADNQNKIASHHELIKKYESDITSLHSLKTELASYEASLNEKNQSIKSRNEQLAVAVRQIPNSNPTEDFNSNLTLLNNHIAFLQSEISGKTAVKSNIENFQSNLLLVSNEIAKAETTKLSSRNLEKNVFGSATCPVCLQPITEQHKTHFRNKLNQELAESERIIMEKNAEKATINSQILLAKQKLDAMQEKDGKLSGFSVLSRQFFQIAEESSTSAIYDLSKKISDAKLKLQNYSSLEADSNAIKSRLEGLQQREKELLIKKATIDKELENLNSNILLAQKEISEKESYKKQLAYNTQLRNWLDEHFINLMEVIERSVMLRVYNEFNQLFQSWFNILMENEAVSGRLDDSFAPVVEINGYDIPLENLSGGEKTSCALAYRLALNKVINDVISTIKTNQLLILDEPTDGFSSQQLEKVRDVLEQLQLPQIIIVSHEPKIESFVQNVIHIAKEQHVSHVIA